VALCAAALAWSEFLEDETPPPESTQQAPAVVPPAAPAPAPSPAPRPEAPPAPAPPPPEVRPAPATRPLGVFRVTAYCPCARCCGRWAALPASQRPPLRGPYCAADLRVLPKGTSIHVQGIGWRQVSDTGGDIVGGRIDLLMKSHRRAVRFGKQWRRVEVQVPSPSERTAPP